MQPDLNLLRALDILLGEGSVSKAARKLQLSPSAMSRTLARLREVTGDQLLVRAGRGKIFDSIIDTIGDTWSRFGLAFYLYALLFVAFDVEIIFVYLWAVMVRELSGQGIVVIGIFLAILMWGELYAWKKGDLRWQ